MKKLFALCVAFLSSVIAVAPASLSAARVEYLPLEAVVTQGSEGKRELNRKAKEDYTQICVLANKQVELFQKAFARTDIDLKTVSLTDVYQVKKDLESVVKELGALVAAGGVSEVVAQYHQMANETLRLLNLSLQEYRERTSDNSYSYLIPVGLAVSVFGILLAFDYFTGNELQFGAALKWAIAVGLVSALVTYRREIAHVAATVVGA